MTSIEKSLRCRSSLFFQWTYSGELMSHPQGTLNLECLLIHVTCQRTEAFHTHILCSGWHTYIWEPILAFLYLHFFFFQTSCGPDQAHTAHIYPAHTRCGMMALGRSAPVCQIWAQSGHAEVCKPDMKKSPRRHIQKQKPYISHWGVDRKLICHSTGYRYRMAELTQIQVVHGSLCC